jgi:dihydroxy-acid dehydratase
MGVSEEDFHKPKIAVVNTSSTLSVCYIHLDRVSQVVQQAIREAGGLPFEIRTAAPSDFITSAGKKARYLMPTRDLIVNDIEVMVEGASSTGWYACLLATRRRPATSWPAPGSTFPRSSSRADTRLGACAPGVTWTSTTCTSPSGPWPLAL